MTSQSTALLQQRGLARYWPATRRDSWLPCSGPNVTWPTPSWPPPIPGDGLLAETENSHKGFVDSPLLLGADPAYQVPETPGVDRAHLLDENSCDLIEYMDLWAERGGSGTARCRRNKHNGPGQEFVGLDYHAKSSPLLLVTLTARHPELMDVTPEHEGSP